MDRRVRARFEILLAATLFSTGGAAIKAISLGGWQVAAGRSLFGALALFVLVPGARRVSVPRTWLVAAPYAATLILYVQSNKLTTAANAIFLQSTAPLYLLAIGPLLLGERIRRADLVYMAALATGLALFLAGLEPPQRTATDPALGNVLAAVSGLTWALTVAGLRSLARPGAGGGEAREAPAAAAAAQGNLLVVLVALPFALPLAGASFSDLLGVAYLGTFQIGLAYVFLVRGVRDVSALEGGLLLLLEPVLNTLASWLVNGEVPGLLARAGAGVILVATAAHAVHTRRRARPGPA